MKYVPKSAFAEAAGVSYKTFQRWMVRNRERLEELGFRPTAKLVSPRVAQFICREYDIDIEELQACA